MLRNPDLLMVLGFFAVFLCLRTRHPLYASSSFAANGRSVRYLPNIAPFPSLTDRRSFMLQNDE
ncbi:hypothetical protein [Paenibacillus sp. PK3_47]|uniref:hypothetical protein n=1 Tax=Paenibacillus sp. PK3_47 TaxID=2072642 RepID=UPI00201DBF40|nr:hypothetical protein [Paenibacillus sp. PK3_47]